MTCLQYHTLNCEDKGPHQTDRNGPQGIRVLPMTDKGRGPRVCYVCYMRWVRKWQDLNRGTGAIHTPIALWHDLEVYNGGLD